MAALPTPEQIGVARVAIIHYIDRLPGTDQFLVKEINRRNEANTLPRVLKQAMAIAWNKPRTKKLTISTLCQWRKRLKERGHCNPLIKQKDTEIKDWHGLAYLLRQRNPKMKAPWILEKLNASYPEVSIHQLHRYLAELNKAGAFL